MDLSNEALEHLNDLSGAQLASEMPLENTIIFADEFVTPQGRKIVVTKTLELDEYEYDERQFESRADIFVANAEALAEPSNDFRGTSRKATKLSIADADIESFDDVNDLVNTLPDHDDMADRDPPISKGANSNRVTEEVRNVSVSAFLYAASREDDNDYHLIIGRSPALTDKTFITVEISGLPPASSPFFGQLDTARTSYKDFFGSNLPGLGYDFYDPPIPVTVEGSLFFDMSHATGSRPGPQKLRPFMPVVWEIHPISSIEFES